MKKYRIALILGVLMAASFSNISAQGRPMQLYVVAGYQFGGQMEFYEGNFDIEDKGCIGIGLDVETYPGMKVGFSYSRMNTTGYFDSYYPLTYPSEDYDLTVDYFQLNVKRGQTKGPVEGYGLFSLGATWFNMLEEDIEDGWMFSTALGAGANYFISDQFGIKVQARLLLPMYFAGQTMFEGIGTGANTVVSAYTWSSIVQGDFSGGIVYKFGD